MAKTLTSISSLSAITTATISEDLPPDSVKNTIEIFSDLLIPETSVNYFELFSHVMEADLVQRGHVSCAATVLPAVTNGYNGLHGGAVAAIAERLAIACARTIVAEDKQLFLGELSMSYLSAAQQNEILIVDASVVRSGRNLTVVAIDFKIKKTGKLVYLARATFYHMPIAKL